MVFGWHSNEMLRLVVYLSLLILILDERQEWSADENRSPKQNEFLGYNSFYLCTCWNHTVAAAILVCGWYCWYLQYMYCIQNWVCVAFLIPPSDIRKYTLYNRPWSLPSTYMTLKSAAEYVSFPFHNNCLLPSKSLVMNIAVINSL